MRLFSAPTAVLGLIAIAHLPSAIAKPYPVHIEEFQGQHNASQIEKRDCPSGGFACGYYGKLCCASEGQCYTDAAGQAQCSGGGVAAPAGTGSWQTFTTTWVVNGGPQTYTSVYSSFVGVTVAATPTGSSCSGAQSPCGSNCCNSGFYCGANTQCVLLGGGSSGGILPSAPLRPTSSGVVVVTFTGTPTATGPFQSPIMTGVAGAPVPVAASSGGLSGGAIAGIVIGVLLGIFLLLLLCLFCCARALFDTIAAIFGFGKKKNKHTHEETYIEEHHHSGGGAAAGGGRWYGQGRPSRPARSDSGKKHGVGKGLGMAAALGGLALALGLKRKHDRKHDEKSTTVSGSSYYSYSDYTSSSSASSDDRRTRNTRHSSRRP